MTVAMDVRCDHQRSGGTVLAGKETPIRMARKLTGRIGVRH